MQKSSVFTGRLVFMEQHHYYHRMSEVRHHDANSIAERNAFLEWLQLPASDESLYPDLSAASKAVITGLYSADEFDPTMVSRVKQAISDLENPQQQAAAAMLVAGFERSLVKTSFSPQTIRNAVTRVKLAIRSQTVIEKQTHPRALTLMPALGTIAFVALELVHPEQLAIPVAVLTDAPSALPVITLEPRVKRKISKRQPSEKPELSVPLAVDLETVDSPEAAINDDTILAILEACDSDFTTNEKDSLFELLQGAGGDNTRLARERIAKLLSERENCMPSSCASSPRGQTPSGWQALSQLSGHMPAKQVPPKSLATIRSALTVKFEALYASFDAGLEAAFVGLTTQLD